MHRYCSYELWRSEEMGAVVTTMIPSDHPQHDLLIEHGYEHVASILGDGWDDAMKNYNSLIDASGVPSTPFGTSSSADDTRFATVPRVKDPAGP